MVTRIGTDRAETLRGTADDDILDGRGGDDRLSGLQNDDFLLGGAGANRLDGGTGRDAVASVYEEDEGFTGFRPVTADLARGSYVYDGSTNRLTSIENAFGSDQDDTLAGDGGANRLFGFDGDDTLRGRGGDDTLGGGRGTDRIFGDGGADTIENSGGGADEIRAGSGGDFLTLGPGGSQVWGDAGADQFRIGSTFGGTVLEPLFTIRDFSTTAGDVLQLRDFPATDGSGGAQPYVFIGTDAFGENGVGEVRFERRGNDTLVQFEVDDSADFGSQTNQIRLSGRPQLTADDFLLGFRTTPGDDTVTGTAFADSIFLQAGDDAASGLGGNDLILGDEGDDRISGGPGDDQINGGDGADTYDGGPGDDLLLEFSEGPSGANTFLFSGRFGHDTVTLFSGGQHRAVFAGLERSDVSLARLGSEDLLVTVRATGDSAEIESFYGDSVEVELVFDDGTLAADGVA